MSGDTRMFLVSRVAVCEAVSSLTLFEQLIRSLVLFLLFFFFNERSVLCLPWEVRHSVVVRVSSV